VRGCGKRYQDEVVREQEFAAQSERQWPHRRDSTHALSRNDNDGLGWLELGTDRVRLVALRDQLLNDFR
jgi:hypothetical protein